MKGKDKMKKISWIVLGTMLFGTTAYAQTLNVKSADSSPKPKSVAALIERSQGKILTIQKADLSKASYGKFTLIDSSGKKIDFELIPKSQIYSKDSAPLVFSDLKKGDQVIVLFVRTLKGINSVITITQSK